MVNFYFASLLIDLVILLGGDGGGGGGNKSFKSIGRDWDGVLPNDSSDESCRSCEKKYVCLLTESVTSFRSVCPEMESWESCPVVDKSVTTVRSECPVESVTMERWECSVVESRGSESVTLVKSVCLVLEWGSESEERDEGGSFTNVSEWVSYTDEVGDLIPGVVEGDEQGVGVGVDTDSEDG